MSSLKRFKHLFKGFTLVELIVVISVLAVLATIAMAQVSNITAWARDSQRMTDMSAMKSSIELYKAKTGKLPIPTNGSGVTYSGGLLWTQGTFGESVTREIKSITPKPIDPINKIEYVYSIANNNREFELGGILEKATSLLLPIPLPLPQGRGIVGREFGTNLSKDKLVPQTPFKLFENVHAASQNVTFIEWTYNGISLKVETGSKTYVVAAPSLIWWYLWDAKMENTGLTIEWLWSLPKGFSGVVVSTANTGTFAPIIAWSGTTLPTTSTGAESMIIGLQSAYSGSAATSLSQISSLVSATGSQITALGEGLVENALGGTVSTPMNQNPETPILSFFAGSGTTASPWKKSDGSALASCQEYNLNATETVTGALRGTGTCASGTKQCLSSGIYSIRPVDVIFSTYCDMTTDGGGWTVVAQSTNPSLWTPTNTYGMWQYEYWLDVNNYTYDMRKILTSNSFSSTVSIRFYDHIIPTNLDIRYSFTKSDYLAIDFDAESPWSVAVPKTNLSSVFSASAKTYGVVSTYSQPTFIVLTQDAAAAIYCWTIASKWAIEIMNGDENYIHSAVCGNGLRGYIYSPFFTEYNLTDAGRRVSIGIR